MEVGHAYEVFNLRNLVVLQVQIFDLLLSFKKWDVSQQTRVESHLFGVGLTLTRSSVDNHDVGDLGQLDVD